MPSSSTLLTMKKFFFSLFLLHKSCEISEILKQKKAEIPPPNTHKKEGKKTFQRSHIKAAIDAFLNELNG